MKKHPLLIVLLLLALLLSACGARRDEGGAVSIWYAEGDPLAPALQWAAEQYNRDRAKDAPSVSLRAFADEERLAASLEAARPDLLLCSHERAFDLYERGLLIGLSVPDPSLPDWLMQRSDSVGGSVFPLGARVPLLYARQDAALGGDLLSLCAGAADRAQESRMPWLASDSAAALFCQALLDQGREFHADGGREIYSDEYRQVYNTLARAVGSGGLLLTGGESAALAQAGAVPCAWVFSDALSGAAAEDMQFLLPRADGGRLAELRCLAAMPASARGAAGAAAFLRWLYEGDRLGALMLRCGLVPVTAAPEEGGPLSAALLDAAGEALVLPGADSDYAKNRDAFEERFRRETEFLQ